ncbi:hypothetical protein C2S52_015613 [Perilla frutescens var. hirtella]|uniref:Uncharacterized protein n=1 Tax=Perilla frutescens var. hirtella TaxID=608512 RepID=A0AAD4P6Y5_PERFH|nr:hypothetical protein C2S52_015613 [Perilla frutescens var. hirtella]KAH6815575.1 hypothetical protein C2S51_020395 [Perilla frutescens var. frutescens]KAH6828042.1 hypothetical protein C2S53_005488 [Perilla frutescens var. hirtella]
MLLVFLIINGCYSETEAPGRNTLRQAIFRGLNRELVGANDEETNSRRAMVEEEDQRHRST